MWGLFAGYAIRLAPSQAGRALAIAGIGAPIALAFGVPLGSWLGGMFGWRNTFWIMSALAGLLFVWVRFGVRDFAGQAKEERQSLWQVFTLPGIRPVLLAMFLWIISTYTMYTYVGPYLAHFGMGERVDEALMLYGVCGFAGIWIAGLFVDKKLRLMALMFLTLFILTALILVLALSGLPALMIFAMAIWGFTIGASPVILQTALAKNAGNSVDIAQSIYVTIYCVGFAGGGAVGGLLLDKSGVSSLPWFMLVLGVLSLMVVWLAKKTGFKNES